MRALALIFLTTWGLSLLLSLGGSPAMAQAQRPPEPATENASVAPASPAGVLVESVGFYYKLDADARFYALRAQWERDNKTPTTLTVLEELASRAYYSADVEREFDVWLDQGGPNPLVFRPKVHIRNNTPKAWLNVQLRVAVRGKVGKLLVDPDLYLTDYDYLTLTSAWENLMVEDYTIDVLAPGEEKLVDVRPFSVFEFMNVYPNQWPEFLEVEALLLNPAGSPSAVGALHMVPDHFIVPLESYRRLTQ